MLRLNYCDEFTFSDCCILTNILYYWHIQTWNKAREAYMQKYWALVIGTPKEREGVIAAPISKVFLFVSYYLQHEGRAWCKR